MRPRNPSVAKPLFLSCLALGAVATSRALPDLEPGQLPGMRCIVSATSCGQASQYCVGGTPCEYCDGNLPVASYCTHAYNLICATSGSVACGDQFHGVCDGTKCVGGGAHGSGCPLASPCAQ